LKSLEDDQFSDAIGTKFERHVLVAGLLCGPLHEHANLE